MKREREMDWTDCILQLILETQH